MSHTVEIKTEVRDASGIDAACRRLGLPEPQFGLHRLFQSEPHQGYAVRLRGWEYPAVFDVETGQCHCDTFNGRWGEPARLDEFLQAYAIEKCKAEARRKGYQAYEQALPDGSVKLTIDIGS